MRIRVEFGAVGFRTLGKAVELMSFSISDWGRVCFACPLRLEKCQNRLNDWPFSNTQSKEKSAKVEISSLGDNRPEAKLTAVDTFRFARHFSERAISRQPL